MNEQKVQAGDVWLSRGGEKIFITEIKHGDGWPVKGNAGDSDNMSFTDDGIFSSDGSECKFDLITLVQRNGVAVEPAPVIEPVPEAKHAFAVGQVWKTRGGEHVTINATNGSGSDYPITTNANTSHTIKGRYLVDGSSHRDLVELAIYCDAITEQEPPAPVIEPAPETAHADAQKPALSQDAITVIAEQIRLRELAEDALNDQYNSAIEWMRECRNNYDASCAVTSELRNLIK